MIDSILAICGLVVCCIPMVIIAICIKCKYYFTFAPGITKVKVG